MITILDYGMGNLGSVLNMFKRIGVDSSLSSNLDEIKHSKKILIPGVGAFDAAMERINQGGFNEVLNYKANIERIPILGICLGMQLLTVKSEEGIMQGLSWIDAETVRFRFEQKQQLKVPHMGWNRILSKQTSPLTDNLSSDSRFYFVHSFYVKCRNPKNIVSTTPYGGEFASIIQRDNIYGAQFHPEKSHKFGMQLLLNFSKL